MMNKMKVMALMVMMIFGLTSCATVSSISKRNITENKRIKSIIATVTVLVLGAFSLHAEEVKAYDQCSGTVKVYTSEMKKPIKVNESKLTNLSYVKKTYKTKYKYVEDGSCCYYSSDGRAIFLSGKVPDTEIGSVVVKLGIVNVNDEVYGRIVVHSHDLTATCNLHDAKCSVKGRLAAYINEEGVEDITKQLKGLVIKTALDFTEESKEKTN